MTNRNCLASRKFLCISTGTCSSTHSDVIWTTNILTGSCTYRSIENTTLTVTTCISTNSNTTCISRYCIRTGIWTKRNLVCTTYMSTCTKCKSLFCFFSYINLITDCVSAVGCNSVFITNRYCICAGNLTFDTIDLWTYTTSNGNFGIRRIIGEYDTLRTFSLRLSTDSHASIVIH